MEKQIVDDYDINRMTISQIASKYHKGTQTIKEILVENNIHIRTKTENAILKRLDKGITYKEVEEYVIEQYNLGNGLIKSGKKYNLSVNNVRYILKKNGIAIRNHHEAVAIKNINNAYEKNESYFSKQSHNMAWIIGFLAADGTVRSNNNSIKIGLAKKDKEVLEKIKKELQIGNPITEYTSRKGYDVVELNWTCKQHKEDLKSFSIVPNKTFILKPPYKLKKQYWIDYIRGYFDGDGSINLINNKDQKSLRWQVCSATPELLQWIVDYFAENGIPIVKIQVQQRKEPLYYIQYSTNSTKKIYSILYNESPMFLKRKKEYYEEILKSFNE